MQSLEVSWALRPLQWPLGSKWLKNPVSTWKLGYRQNLRAISRPIVPPFATGSARVVGDVEASGGESGTV
jgi:hypothetical protein